MSLKKILLKSTATFLSASILFSNCSMVGLGIKAVIAEDEKAPDIAISAENSQYVQYKKEEYSGVAVEAKIAVEAKQQENVYLPVEEVALEISLPAINGIHPEKAVLAKASTAQSTGETQNENVNQNYDSGSGLLTLSYKNEQEYSQYKENTKDEFEIIYIYPSEAYIENAQETNLDYTINANAKFKTENSSIVSQNVQTIKTTETQNKGDISTFGVTSISSNIYKGFMYSNVENKTNYNTEYKTVSTLSVLNSSIMDEITMEINESNFIKNGEAQTEVKSNGNIICKKTTISKSEFNKMLGQDGVVEIYNEDTLLATIKYLDIDNSKKLAVIYSEENIKILSDEETSVVVEYADNVTSLKIKTTKPITEGFMNFENENCIKPNTTYGAPVKDLKYISLNTSVNTTKKEIVTQSTEETTEDETTQEQLQEKIVTINTYNAAAKTELREPTTKISVISSNQNFPTLQTSKTTLTIKLDDTNSSAKLFDNPVITITLPNGITGGNLSSPEILNGNGLSIKNTSAKGNVITLELEGKQTSYNTVNVSGGVNIVMDIENIDFNDATPSHLDQIQVACTQGNEITKTSCNVNIVSKQGLLMLSNVTGYNASGDVTTSIDANVKTIKLDRDAKAKEITQTLTLVNNYDQDMENVEIIGRIGYSDNNVASTFAPELSKPITVNNENAKVYYSESKDADYANGEWTENFMANAGSYKIVLNNAKIAKAGNVQIKVNATIPENLNYNQATYLKTEANYMYNSETKKDTSTVAFKTDENQLLAVNSQKIETLATEAGETIPVKITLSPIGITNEKYVHSGQVVTYEVRVENNSNENISGLKLEDVIPENAIYTYKEEKQGDVANYIEQVTDATKKSVTWKKFSLKAGEIQTTTIMLTMANVDSEQTITNTLNLKYNDKTVSTVTSDLTLKPAKITTSLTTKEESYVSINYEADSTVEYYIKVKNNTTAKIEGAKVQYEIPTNLTYVEGGLGNYDEFEGYSIKEVGTLNNNVFEYTIKEIKAQEEKTIVVRCKVARLTQDYEADITSIANVILENDIYQTNIKTIQTKQAAFEISLTSNVKQTDTLKAGDDVTYTIQVKNVGKNSSRFTIKDIVPNEVELEKLEYYTDSKDIITILTPSSDIDIRNSLEPQEIFTIKITGKVATVETEKIETRDITNVAELVNGNNTLKSNSITFKMQTQLLQNTSESDNSETSDGTVVTPPTEGEIVKDQTPDIPKDESTPETPTTPEKPTTPETPSTPTTPESPETPNTPTTPDNPITSTYTISGIAWIDSNKNGQREQGEKLQDSVVASLLNAETGEYVKDASGNKITVTTNSNGEYKFENISKGKYIVLFEFDSNTYTVTTYQKTGVEKNVNSDAIISTTQIDGQSKLAAITDEINLTANYENIDIGLIENAEFDLSLSKQITKVTVINSKGTEEYEFKDGDTAKVDLVAKYINSASVVVNYKFTIKNEGDTVGYVDSLVDNLPSGLEFSSELNPNWYKSDDGKLTTTELAGKPINPGETQEVELTLTKNMNANNAGSFTNNAELTKVSNLEGIAEKTSGIENNKDSAILFLSIKTGSTMMYVGITLICIAIIAVGAYIINKKILNEKI